MHLEYAGNLLYYYTYSDANLNQGVQSLEASSDPDPVSGHMCTGTSGVAVYSPLITHVSVPTVGRNQPHSQDPVCCSPTKSMFLHNVIIKVYYQYVKPSLVQFCKNNDQVNRLKS